MGQKRALCRRFGKMYSGTGSNLAKKTFKAREVGTNITTFQDKNAITYNMPKQSILRPG
jgi:hypothetical protein